MASFLLASSSVYRRELLTQLGFAFTWANPEIDETPLAEETAEYYVERLAREKALALKSAYPEHWIIGSDQCCVIDGAITGKPLSAENAIAQLSACSGQTVRFVTGLSLVSPAGDIRTLVEPFTVHFRQLSKQEIVTYVALEKPLDCAGSFKVEGLGIHLFERLEGRDFHSLIGLPLIALGDLLRDAGFSPLALALND